jgi:hypothetical protein
MGYWGMVMNEKDDETWDSIASKIIDGLENDTLLVLVDCHI